MEKTAVKWLIEQISYKTTNGEIISYHKDISKLVEQDKEMEKEQHQETFKQSRQAKIFEKDIPPVWKSFDEYHNKTFKSE